jgi:4-hydroxymandelate oxidase
MPQRAVRLVPRADLVNVVEFEEQAKRALEPAVFARIAGGDRAAFDRLTLRPRVMIPTRSLDLGLSLLGHTHNCPIIAGPIDPATLPGDSLATALLGGAAASGSTLIAAGALAARADISQMKTPVWCQVFATNPGAIDDVKRAMDAGCRAACITVGAQASPKGVRAANVDARQWRSVQSIASSVRIPVIVKGTATASAAKLALQHGAQGIVFSNYGGLLGRGDSASILELAGIVDAVAGQVPVLADGGYRRGTDVLKALALGASAVLVTRPVAWGVVAYGADGVQGVLELLQTELARYMAMSGKVSLESLDRSMVKVHAR